MHVIWICAMPYWLAVLKLDDCVREAQGIGEEVGVMRGFTWISKIELTVRCTMEMGGKAKENGVRVLRECASYRERARGRK
jgi:hypothetical protein